MMIISTNVLMICVENLGGPALLFKNHWILVGIVSFGPRWCGTENVPAIYTSVVKYVDWITASIKE